MTKSRQDEIQTELNRLMEKVDRGVMLAFPKTTVTCVAHDIAGYADRTMIEKACRWLCDYNRRQAKAHGAKATLAVREFTVDINEFRKAMEGET